MTVFKSTDAMPFQARVLAVAAVLVFAPNANHAQSAAQGDQGRTYKRIPEAEIQKHIDRNWVRKSLVNDLLDHWLKASVMPNGFIQENLDRKWEPWGEQREASLNGQGRVLYTLAIGYEVSGGDKGYLDAITKAADFLLKMHDDQYGGYFNRTTPDLKVIDDTKGGFQSFAIFSLAHAARVTKDQRYADAAMAAYHELKAKMQDGPFISGNFKRDFSGPAPRGAGFGGRGRGPAGAAGAPAAARGGFQMEPGGHRLDVHMFEALLGLYEATKSKEVWDTISAQMDVMAKVYNYDLGYLSESYDANWKPVGNPGANPGHLFEWASLLSHAVELGADPKFIELGSRNIDFGLKSYNKEVGGLGGRNANGEPTQMLWWPQCEVIKATAHYATLRGRSDLWPVYQQTLDFVKKTYLDTEFGGWFEGYIPGTPRSAMGDRAYIKGAVDGPELSPYHMTSMFHDLWRISDPKYKAENKTLAVSKPR
jgi:mannose/cellobiose epimerase-like protein (N-acyl-D-glucosamine 2-epimerase family)